MYSHTISFLRFRVNLSTDSFRTERAIARFCNRTSFEGNNLVDCWNLRINRTNDFYIKLNELVDLKSMRVIKQVNLLKEAIENNSSLGNESMQKELVALIEKIRKNYFKSGLYLIIYESFFGIINPLTKKGEIFLMCDGVKYLDFAIDHVIYELFRIICPEHNAFLLHSSSLIYKNKAILFIGKSGSGKSTIYNKSKKFGFERINEDMGVVAKKGNNYFIQDFFYGRKHLKNKVYPISKIYYLHHSKKNHLKKMTPSESKKLMKKQVFISNKNTKRNDLLILDVCKKYPSYLLYFKKDCHFLKSIRN